MQNRAAHALAVFLLVAAAPTLPAGAADAGDAAIEILTPTGGANQASGTVLVTVDVTAFNLVNHQTAAGNADATGHIHYFVDGDLATGSYPGHYATTDKTFVVAGLAPGEHTIRVELVNNAHSSFAPAVADEVTFTVTDGAPSIQFVSPAGLTPAENGELTVALDVERFTFSQVKLENLDPNQPATGHIHYFVDGELAESADEDELYATTSTTFTYANLGPGPHTLKAELVNNDHSSFDPPVYAELVVNAPTVVFTNVATGDEVGQTFEATVNVTGLTFSDVNLENPENRAGEGHIHYFVDGAPATSANDGQLYASADKAFRFTDLTPGEHVITAELVANDHSSLNPPVVARATVNVIEPSIALAGDLADRVAPSFDLTVDVAGYDLVDFQTFTTPHAGQGHIHYFVDGELAPGNYATPDTTYRVAGLAPGEHTLRAELVNNDHSPLDPPVFVEETLTVVGEPTIRVSAPTEETVIPDFDFTVDVENFDLVDFQSASGKQAGEGHIHYLIDGELAPGNYATPETTYGVAGLVPGEHTLRAELVNNDHSPLQPAAFVEKTVTVALPTPQITASAPTSAAAGQGFDFTVAVEGFDLVAVQESPENALGEGHIHYLIDGELAPGNYATPETTYRVESLDAGTHTLRAELVNNDHSSLTPPVFIERTVTVTAADMNAKEGEDVNTPNNAPGFGGLAALAALGAALMAFRRKA